MPTLDWIGKNKVINHHQAVPFKVLERKYSFDENGQHEEDNGSENMIIKGDNLEALKALLPRYEGRIKCIYIDPPYNTGFEGWVYNDNVNDPNIKKWLGKVVGKEGEDLSRHDKWLCMMYPRLKLLRRLLSQDGVFFVSIGDDELTNLLYLVNEIFGRINAIFVWKSRSKPTNAGNAKYRPQKVAEYVIMFTQDENKIFNVGQREDDYSYPYTDKNGSYRTSTILTSNLGSYKRETMRFEVAGYTPPADKRWKAGYVTIKNLLDNNRLLFTKDGTPMEKIYDYDNESVITPLYTLIDPKISGSAESGKTTLNKIIGMGHGFDTVKPNGLIEYLIGICTNKNDIVLDSFAGTGTTAHAVLNINKADGGHRKFILIEMMDYAESITATRLKEVINGYKADQENILYNKEITIANLANGVDMLNEANAIVAAAKEKFSSVRKPKIENGHLIVTAITKAADQIAGTGGNFSYYELGEPLLVGDCLNEDVPTEKIREYVWFMETKMPFIPPTCANQYYLGQHNDTAYYFYYKPKQITVLDYAFLATIKEKVAETVIYADRCSIGEDKLVQMNITFKKIPRDISKL